MELKWRKSNYLAHLDMGSNRTFMELKFDCDMIGEGIGYEF